eukprot:m51a1_g7982 putative dyp-type peroxidase family protein (1715) ;mRNA; r:64210-70454
MPGVACEMRRVLGETLDRAEQHLHNNEAEARKYMAAARYLDDERPSGDLGLVAEIYTALVLVGHLRQWLAGFPEKQEGLCSVWNGVGEFVALLQGCEECAPRDALAKARLARDALYTAATLSLSKEWAHRFQDHDVTQEVRDAVRAFDKGSASSTQPLPSTPSDEVPALLLFRGACVFALALTAHSLNGAPADLACSWIDRVDPRVCREADYLPDESEATLRQDFKESTEKMAKNGEGVVPFAGDPWAQFCVSRLRVHNHAWENMQRGLLYYDPLCTIVVTAKFTGAAGADHLAALQQAAGALARKCNEYNAMGKGRTLADFVCGVRLESFQAAFDPEGKWERHIPGCHDTKWIGAKGTHCEMFTDRSASSDVAGSGSGRDDLLFSLRGQDKRITRDLYKTLKGLEERLGLVMHHTEGVATKGKNLVLGEAFLDGLNNPRDPFSLSRMVLINDKDSPCFGATYCFTQSFKIRWDRITEMVKSKGPEFMSAMIGRQLKTNSLIDSPDSMSHMKRGRVFDEYGHVLTMLRQSITYGTTFFPTPQIPEIESPVFEDCAYIISFANSTDVLKAVAGGIGAKKLDQFETRQEFNLMSMVEPQFGGLWYIPNQSQLRLKSTSISHESFPALEKYYDVSRERREASSSYVVNPYLFYNDFEWLHRNSMELLRLEGAARAASEAGEAQRAARRAAERVPSARVIDLMGNTFQDWNSTWYRTQWTPLLRPLQDYLPKGDPIATLSVARRKGRASKETLSQMVGQYGVLARQFNIRSRELIVGSVPHLPAIPMGKVCISYLTEQERTEGALCNLDESSAPGHLVPCQRQHLEKGWERLRTETRDFYLSVVDALEGMQLYALGHARLAMYKASKTSQRTARVRLVRIAERLSRLALYRPVTLVDAAQAVFILHACLQLQGDPCSLGRLDDDLLPFYEACPEGAQDVVSCLWMKIGERVLLDRRRVQTTHRGYGTVAVPYTSGPFPGGISVNQWVQQVTLGGKPVDGSSTPRLKNELTKIMLRASRMLPLVAPCLSLRLWKGTDAKVIKEAVKCLLSGGANPLLFNDEKMLPALQASGPSTARGSHYQWAQQACAQTYDVALSPEVLHSYACDGCYEPIFPGETEFAFVYKSLLDPLEWALNYGCSVQNAGAFYLAGSSVSYRSPDPDSYASLADVQREYARHLRLLATRTLAFIAGGYGGLARFCPSPLLSAFTGGCLERGRDVSDGGARLHVVMVFWMAFAHAVDSLYALRRLCYPAAHEPRAGSALRPSDLVRALYGNWGAGELPPPFWPYSAFAQNADCLREERKRLQGLREEVLALPKWGRTDQPEAAAELRGLAQWLSELVLAATRDAAQSEPLARRRRAVEEQWGARLMFQAGAGTNENYVGMGLAQGASLDGRLSGQPLAANSSPAPWPADRPVSALLARRLLPAGAVLGAYAGLADYPDGNEAILRVGEDSEAAGVARVVEAFGRGGAGPSMLSLNCCDARTMLAPVDARRPAPERYALVRLRHGGWSDYYVAMHDACQQHQLRRPAVLLPLLSPAAPPAAPAPGAPAVFVGALDHFRAAGAGGLALSLEGGWECSVAASDLRRAAVCADYCAGAAGAARVVAALRELRERLRSSGLSHAPLAGIEALQALELPGCGCGGDPAGQLAAVLGKVREASGPLWVLGEADEHGAIRACGGRARGGAAQGAIFAEVEGRWAAFVWERPPHEGPSAQANAAQ